MTQLVRCETFQNQFEATQHRYHTRLWKNSINEGLETPSGESGTLWSPPTTVDAHWHERGLYLVRCRGSCLWVVSTGFLLLDLDPRHGGRVQGIQEARRLHCCSKTIRQLEIQPLLLLERVLGLNLRCAGMILTLISLAEFDGVFKGLYFFSKGVFSNGPELTKRNKQA